MNADELSVFPTSRQALSVRTDIGPLIAEGRILDAVSSRDLRGTPDEIAAGLDVSASDLHLAIDELAGVAWIVVECVSERELVVRLAEDARHSA